MKKNSLLKYEIISTILIIIIGTILHFTYKWSNNNWLVGIFSAVNESTWEHLKLIYYPMLLSILFGKYYYKNQYNNYVCVKTKDMIISIIFTIVFFYTYSGIIGKNYGFINILSYVVSIIVGQIYSYKHINKYCNKKINILLLILLILFIIFTFSPPHINIFLDPVNKTYGV